MRPSTAPSALGTPARWVAQRSLRPCWFPHAAAFVLLAAGCATVIEPNDETPSSDTSLYDAGDASRDGTERPVDASDTQAHEDAETGGASDVPSDPPPHPDDVDSDGSEPFDVEDTALDSDDVEPVPDAPDASIGDAADAEEPDADSSMGADADADADPTDLTDVSDPFDAADTTDTNDILDDVAHDTSDVLDDTTDASDDADADPAPGWGLDTLLAALDADAEGTLYRVHVDEGWPVQLVDGAWVIAWTDTSLTHAAGDFDAWAGTPSQQRTGYRWISLGPGATGRYKLTDRTRWVADPWARTISWDEFGEMSWIAALPPRLDRYRSLPWGELPARTVWVHVPDEEPGRVLYMQDGRNVFRPTAPHGGWRMLEQDLADVLVVAIDHSDQRMNEYTHTPDRISGVEVGGAAGLYVDYLVDTFRPWIEDRYEATGPVGILGSSLGGLVSLYAIVRRPDAFDFAGSLSGTVGWGRIGSSNVTIIERMADPAWQSAAVVYVDSGGGATLCADTNGDGIRNNNTGASDNYCENLQLRDTLADRGRTFGVDLWHWHEPNAPHSEAAWAARVHRPLAIFRAME